MTVQITIQSPEETQILHVRNFLGFQAICAKHQTPIEFDCRKADCGICTIRILKGQENLNPPGEEEKDFLLAMNADEDERLACQVRVKGDVSVQVDYL
jgi:ferredoxin